MDQHQVWLWMMVEYCYSFDHLELFTYEIIINARFDYIRNISSKSSLFFFSSFSDSICRLELIDFLYSIMNKRSEKKRKRYLFRISLVLQRIFLSEKKIIISHSDSLYFPEVPDAFF